MLRKKVLFSLCVILIFRILAHVPVPGVNIAAIRQYLEGNQLLGLLNIFSGGGFQNFSIVTLGLNPYINATIIIQLFTMVIPSLEKLSKEEGEAGREKINMYSRLLTIPIALLQAYGMYFLLFKQSVIPALNVYSLLLLIITLTAGTILLMWIGELVTEYGLGNGISLLIFVGIIGRLPTSMYQFIQTLTADDVLKAVVFIALGLAVIALVVLVNEGTRNIPLEYGRSQARSQKVTNYLPIKINQAGVIPIIFAISIVLIPSLIASPLQTSSIPALQNIGQFLSENFVSRGLVYNVFYFVLVFAFTYFYTSINFQPDKISEDIKKRGGFVLGVRPGKETAKYLGDIINKITLSGALFLSLIAILPYILEKTVGLTNIAVGGTSLLIVVSVILETIRQAESMRHTKNYQSFLD